MQEDDESSYLPRQLDAVIRLSDSDVAIPAPYVTSAIGRDALLVRGGPRLPIGCRVELRLLNDQREALTIQCVTLGQSGPDQRLKYENLAFDERVRLEDLMRPYWDGIDVLDGLATMAGLYGATSLKDWLCMTSLLERMQPHALHRTHSGPGL
ncbi:hypothetical protein G3480_14950 [Thiorhodococcus mannitoliphagus]|uniref:PilZ domain-containing protein n=1 Tax=Thiorhodococcus mannitoliphagus TaxID=329406 RepID=A0A6P1DWU2_9GAMM|nr:hypothetical protein [Thiorhodococcus mannitoliphagus]NEX21593.1 hypothetical protein [Thiorhodococcus mannitoliphagus]